MGRAARKWPDYSCIAYNRSRFRVRARVGATACVYTLCGSLCARRCAGIRCPVAQPSLPSRIPARTRNAYAREEGPSVVPDAAILESWRSRQTTRRLDERTIHQRHRVCRQVQQESPLVPTPDTEMRLLPCSYSQLRLIEDAVVVFLAHLLACFRVQQLPHGSIGSRRVDAATDVRNRYF